VPISTIITFCGAFSSASLSHTSKLRKDSLLRIFGGILGDIVDEKYCGTIAIIAFDDRLEAFLTCCIPNSHFDIEAFVYLYEFGCELDTLIANVNTYCDVVFVLEGVFGIAD
jgi:hypothetical protein